MTLPWEEQSCHSPHQPLRFSHLTIIIMSNENPFETNPIRKIVGSFESMLFSPVHLSRAPSPSPIKMDSSSDNLTRWVTNFFSPTFHWNSFVPFIIISTSPLNIVPVQVGVDDAPTFATKAYTPPDPPISVPISGLIPVPKRLGSASGRGLETPTTVSVHAVLTIVNNHRSFSTYL